MPVDVVMLLGLKREIDNKWIIDIRTNFLKYFELDLDQFYAEGPFVTVTEKDLCLPKNNRILIWLNVNFLLPYFDKNYRRGNIEFYVRCARWLEGQCDFCEVWYGHDIDDSSICRFDETRRLTLLKYEELTTK
jgi:hypothetical protein